MEGFPSELGSPKERERLKACFLAWNVKASTGGLLAETHNIGTTSDKENSVSAQHTLKIRGQCF